MKLLIFLLLITFPPFIQAQSDSLQYYRHRIEDLENKNRMYHIRIFALLDAQELYKMNDSMQWTIINSQRRLISSYRELYLLTNQGVYNTNKLYLRQRRKVRLYSTIGLTVGVVAGLFISNR